MSWDSITKPFIRDGLGVPDLGEMNVALLVKWIYRYGNEKYRLWRRVASAKSSFDPRPLIMNLNGRNWKFLLVNLIGSLLDKENRVSRIARECFRILIGNSQDSNFWIEDWSVEGLSNGCFLAFLL